MARDVTLSRDQWGVVFNTVRRYAAPQATEDQARQLGLYETLRGRLKEAEGPEATIRLTAWQCKRVDEMLAQPITPWATEGIAVVWAIREALGLFRRPVMDEDEDEE